MTDSHYFSITLRVYYNFSQNGVKLSGKKGNRKRIDGRGCERINYWAQELGSGHGERLTIKDVS